MLFESLKEQPWDAKEVIIEMKKYLEIYVVTNAKFNPKEFHN